MIVTGAAGSLGARVAARLVAGGHRVVGIDARPAAVTGGAQVAHHTLDLAEPADGGTTELDTAMAGADVVVHLAWLAGDLPGPGAGRAGEVNRRATAAVLDAAAAVGARHLVHLSSATVYGAWPDNPVPLTEDAVLRPNPGFAFAHGKAEAERALAEWAAAHPEVAVAVLRPAVTVGGPARPLYLALSATRVPGEDDGSRPVQYLHVDDLAAAVEVVVERRLAGTFNVAPDAGIPEAQARSLAGGVARFSLPPALARPLSAWGWDLWRRGVPREARPYTTHPWVVAPDRLLAAGWQPAWSSEEALVATDDRPHLDDLPPGRRQRLALVGAGTAIAAAGATATAVAVGLRRRRSPGRSR